MLNIVVVAAAVVVVDLDNNLVVVEMTSAVDVLLVGILAAAYSYSLPVVVI